MIIGHQKQQQLINNILNNYQNGLFLLLGPESIGKFYTLKELTQNFSPLIINSEEYVLKINTSRFLHKLLTLTTKNKQIIIINDAHKFNKEAQNKLLKILEEIPNQSLVFLISHKPFKILSTIRSRAQKILFSLVDNQEIEKYLLTQNYQSQEIKFLLKIFPGQIGKIIYFLNNKDKLINIKKIITHPDIFEKYRAFLKINNDCSLEELITYFIIFDRDNLMKKNKSAIKRLKFLLGLYEDAGYFLNKELHFFNIILNIYGQSIRFS